MRKIQTILLSCLLWSTACAEPTYRVLGIGSAAVDLLVQVDDAFFAQQMVEGKGGSVLCDSETIDRIIEMSGTTAKIVPGGSTANTMKALAKLGEASAYFSHIGVDALGHYFCDHLKKGGVVDLLLKRMDLSTPKVLCLITPDGQRTFRAFDPPVHDITLNRNIFTDVVLIHLEARQIRNGLSLQKALQYASDANSIVSLDLSCFEVVRDYRDSLLYLMKEYVDILFCNEDEIFELLGLPPKEGCLKLTEICPTVVVTQGAKGCLVCQKNECLAIPTFFAQVVDTTGAGDHFAAGFLYGYLHHMPLSTCARFGHRLGSAIVEVVGAELPEEKWDEIREFIRKEK
jgi:sugar/nucleoside kinase (ribokinase family)